MAGTHTRTQDLDHKFQRIVIESKRGFKNKKEFATFLHENERFSEISYMRNGEIVMVKPRTIETYITYAQTISLLDNNLTSIKNPDLFSNLRVFQQWLGDCAMDYLIAHNASLSDITSIANQLLSQSPPKLPTIRNVHERLKNPPKFNAFNYSVKIISLLRSSENYELRSNPVFIINGVLVP